MKSLMAVDVGVSGAFVVISAMFGDYMWMTVFAGFFLASLHLWSQQ